MQRRTPATALLALCLPFAAPAPASASVTKVQTATAQKGADFISYFATLTCTVGGAPVSQSATVFAQHFDSKQSYGGPSNNALAPFTSLAVFSDGPCGTFGSIDLSTATFDVPADQVSDSSSVASNLKSATIQATFPVSDNASFCQVAATISVSLTGSKPTVGTHDTVTDSGNGFHAVSHVEGKLAPARAVGTVVLSAPPSGTSCVVSTSTITIDTDQGLSDEAHIQDVKFRTLTITKD